MLREKTHRLPILRDVDNFHYFVNLHKLGKIIQIKQSSGSDIDKIQKRQCYILRGDFYLIRSELYYVWPRKFRISTCGECNLKSKMDKVSS